MLRYNKKLIIRAIGGVILLGSVIVFFWTNNQGAAEGEKVSSVESYASKGKSVVQTKVVNNSASLYMESYRNKKQEQLQLLLIVLLAVGSGFMVYSFIKKE